MTRGVSHSNMILLIENLDVLNPIYNGSNILNPLPPGGILRCHLKF